MGFLVSRVLWHLKKRSLVEICPFIGKCRLLTTRCHKSQETFRHYGSLTSRYMASLQRNLTPHFEVFTALFLKTAFLVGAMLCRWNCGSPSVIHHGALIFRIQQSKCYYWTSRSSRPATQCHISDDSGIQNFFRVNGTRKFISKYLAVDLKKQVIFEALSQWILVSTSFL